jgi:O-antigen ligase
VPGTLTDMIDCIGIAAPVQKIDLVSEPWLTRCSRWALLLTVACLPLYVVRWHYGPFPTTLLETLILATVGLYVAARWREGARRPVATAIDVPVLVLLAAGAVSVLVAADHAAALGLYRAYFLEPIAVFYVAVDLLKGKAHLQRLAFAFAAGSSAFAVLNLVVFARALLAQAVNVGYAPNALYGDANYVAMYMEPPFALAAGFLLLGRGLRWKLFGGIWLALTGAALLATFSKGSYLAVCVLVVVAFVTVPRWRLPLVAAMIAALVAATQIPLMMARLATVASAVDGRQQIIGASIDMIRAHPIFGLGLGGFSYQFRDAAPEVYPHDIWATFWVELGLLGVVAFAWIVFGLLWRGWVAWAASAGFHRALLWGVLGSLVLWITHGLVDSPYWKNDMSVEFWILAALQVSSLAAMARPAVPDLRSR